MVTILTACAIVFEVLSASLYRSALWFRLQDGKRLESGTCDAELAHVQILRALETVQQPGYSKNWGESGRNGSLR